MTKIVEGINVLLALPALSFKGRLEAERMGELHHWHFCQLCIALNHQAHISISGAMTRTVKQDSSRSSRPSFPSTNHHDNLTFGSFDLVSSLFWWETKKNNCPYLGLLVACLTIPYLFYYISLAINPFQCWLFPSTQVPPCLIVSLLTIQQLWWMIRLKLIARKTPTLLDL